MPPLEANPSHSANCKCPAADFTLASLASTSLSGTASFSDLANHTNP